MPQSATTPLGSTKKRSNGKWLDSIKAELDEIRILTGEEPKKGKANSATKTAARGRFNARSASPDRGRQTRPQPEPEPASAPAEDVRQASGQRGPSPARSSRLPVPLSMTSVPSSAIPAPIGVASKENAGDTVSTALSLQTTPINIPVIMPSTTVETIEDDSRVHLEEARLLRGAPQRPCGRYPRSLSPSWGPMPCWPGAVDSNMRWRGAQWSGLTEIQRPRMAAEILTRSEVPFYDATPAFTRTKENAPSSVWSREGSCRSFPQQWADRSNFAGMPRRLDGAINSKRAPIRRTRSASPLGRSQSRSQSIQRDGSQLARADASTGDKLWSMVGQGRLPPALMPTKAAPAPIKPCATALDEWYRHKEQLMTGIGNNMEGVKPWKKCQLGRFNESPRDPADWIYRGIDRQLKLQMESENRIATSRQRSASPRPKTGNDVRPAGVVTLGRSPSPRPASRPSPPPDFATDLHSSLDDMRRMIAEAGRQPPPSPQPASRSSGAGRARAGSPMPASPQGSGRN